MTHKWQIHLKYENEHQLYIEAKRLHISDRFQWNWTESQTYMYKTKVGSAHINIHTHSQAITIVLPVSAFLNVTGDMCAFLIVIISQLKIRIPPKATGLSL